MPCMVLLQKVAALLLGSLAQRGASLAITAELVSVRDDRQLWGEKYNRRAEDVLQVEGEIATTIARTLRRQLRRRGAGEARPRRDRRPGGLPPVPAGARLSSGTRRGDGQERRLPPSRPWPGRRTSPCAHASFAEAYTRQACLRGSGRAEPASKARAAVARAGLDPDLAEARAALGSSSYSSEWDWAGAEAELQRALALNPGSRTVQEEYGGASCSAMGRTTRASAHRAAEASLLDPLSVGPVRDIGINFMARGDSSRRRRASAARSRSTRTGPGDTSSSPAPWPGGKKCPEAMAQSRSPRPGLAGGAAPLSRSWARRQLWDPAGDSARAAEAQQAPRPGAGAIRRPGNGRGNPPAHSARSTRPGLVQESAGGPDTEHGLHRASVAQQIYPSSSPTRATRRSSAAWPLPTTRKLSQKENSCAGCSLGLSQRCSLPARSSPPPGTVRIVQQ